MYKELNPPVRILMGPGVAMLTPKLYKPRLYPDWAYGPGFCQVMNEVADLLREVFGTKNKLTRPCPVPAAPMEP